MLYRVAGDQAASELICVSIDNAVRTAQGHTRRGRKTVFGVAFVTQILLQRIFFASWLRGDACGVRDGTTVTEGARGKKGEWVRDCGFRGNRLLI